MVSLIGPALSTALRHTTRENVCGCDAIVVGAGATGGLSALLLAEAGLKVLVLDAGASRLSLRKAALKHAHRAAHRVLGAAAPGVLRALMSHPAARRLVVGRQPVQSQCYAWPLAPEQFVNDYECPYVTEDGQKFVWLRSRQLGGRMIIPGHGRQYYRFAEADLVPADGLSPAWPLRYSELARWYEVVERKLYLSGMPCGMPWQPSSCLSDALAFSPAEQRLHDLLVSRWPAASPILGVSAPPLDALEAAARTGRLLIRRGAIARQIEVAPPGYVAGVIWTDHDCGETIISRARLVFLCASALESTRLLLLSERDRGGLGSGSGVLGKNLMDHIRVCAQGIGSAIAHRSRLDPARCMYLPRFDSRAVGVPSEPRGFGIQVYHSHGESEFFLAASAFGEMLPRNENRVTIDADQRDAWGVPILRVSCSHGDDDMVRARRQIVALAELAEAVGVTLTQIDEQPAPPGAANHECGTARMGATPTTSVLDGNNECWEAKGLYVTDGACLPSQPCQNPTLTLMALTARACAHAVRSVRNRPSLSVL